MIIGIVVFATTILFSSRCSALDFTKGKYEEVIEKNNVEIERCEKIKTYLHMAADEMRKQENYSEEFVQALSDMWFSQDKYQSSMMSSNNELEAKISSNNQESSNGTLIGYFKITHYCNCSKCCGKWAGGTTASGTKPKEGRTIAVDPNVIPMGSKVIIDGYNNGMTYISEDTGGAIKGNKIDVFVNSHSRALQLGVLYDVPVYLVP